MKKELILVLCLGLLVSGCATSAKCLRKISLDMSKEAVSKELGAPTAVRGAIRNKYNQVVEVWEYKLDTGKTGDQQAREWAFTLGTLGLGAPIFLTNGEIQNYWLYFYDDKLVQWGQAGDWEREADRIYDINFNTGQNITQ